MNRPGQQRTVAQQQPQYRQSSQQPVSQNPQQNQPYAPYAMPPRNVLPGAGYLPQRVPLTSPFIQPRATNGQTNGTGAANFPFGLTHAALPPHLQQQQQQQQVQQQQAQQQQQHTVGSTGEAALDPNDFPALGAPPNTQGSSAQNASNATGTPQSTSSYASAGSAPQTAPSHSHPHSTTSRDLTQDDFPALGENAPPSNNAAANNGAGAPPGLFSTGGAGGIPGMLNLSGMNMLGRHPGPFDDKRHPNPPNPAPPNATSAPFAQSNKANAPLHASSNPPPPPNQNPPNASTNTTAPSGASANTPAWASAAASSNPNPNGATPSFGENGNGNSNNNNSHPSSGALQHTTAALLHAQQQQQQQVGGSHPPPHQQPAHPQTPAQQVLVSAADRWGLLSLVATIREMNTDADFEAAGGRRLTDPRTVRLSGIGTDLGTMGLDMGFSGNLYSTFITPWADQSAAHAVEPDFHLPACYATVQAPPPGPSKASAFSDETLFFMFYASARDALQEVAAQELWNRNWRYHKDLRLWITKESGTAPSTKVHGGEQGLYTIWDADSWQKEHKEMNVIYADLEEKNVPAFAQSATLVPVSQSAAQGVTQQQQQQQQQQRGFAGAV
ncbi:NOT2 family protein [Favolaschia claudopus]|uniref:NOT2 family protein n=1 Tax=Favolaschia claudopus TaxID=2862362 RepID=A0AAW0D9N3_9AGAR